MSYSALLIYTMPILALLCVVDWPKLYYAVLCCVARLSYDDISFDLHSLDRLVSTRFLLIAWLSGLAAESLDWRIWRDFLTWHER